MTHPHIKDVKLLPRHVPVFCQAKECLSKSNPTDAEVWIVSPQGEAVLRLCKEHAQVHNLACAAFEEEWTTAPIFHDEKVNEWRARG